VTYRITRQTARTAVDWLTLAGGTAPALQPIREGEPTEHASVKVADLAERIRRLAEATEGRACVVVPDNAYARLAQMLRQSSGEFGTGDTALDSPIAVLTARETKGLEFDTVVVVDPEAISEQAARGSDIYVACTRATKRLVLVSLVSS
jgi:superfamily I DNA/RNA helicase